MHFPELGIENHYGMYLLPFYLAHEHGMTGFSRSAWEAFATAPALQAIDVVLAPLGGLAGVWPEFVLYSWNKEPVDYFQKWDKLYTEGRSRSVLVSLGSAATVDVFIKGPGAVFKEVSFDEEESDPIPFIEFHNTLTAYPDIAVQALVKIGGQWQTLQDWSSEETVSFCREKDEEQVEELIIIISKSGEATKAWGPAQDPTMKALDSCGWRGEAHGTTNFHTSGDDWTVQMDATDLVFLPSDAKPGRFDAVEGQVTATFSGVYWWSDDGPCMVAGTKTVPAGEGSWEFIQMLSEDEDAIHYWGNGYTEFRVPLTVTCPGEDPISAENGSLHWLYTGGQYSPQVSANPELLEGEYSEEVLEDVDGTWTWRFTRSKEGQ
jgi:hypothetical protein